MPTDRCIFSGALRAAPLGAVMMTLFLAGCAGAPAQQSGEEASLPNIVIILSDDLGYEDVGFNGSLTIPTPNIDRIAREGVRFDQGYVTYPVCGPSRAALLTGRYQSRFGSDRNPNMDPEDPHGGVPLDEAMIPELLAPLGYRSISIGKWHLGTHPSLRPNERGFDHFFGFLSGGHRYFPEELTMERLEDTTKVGEWYHTRLLRNRERVTIEDYLTDELSREAAEVIRETEDPIFLYLAYNAPHTPLQATSEYLDRFPDMPDGRRKTYMAMISAMDDGVGLVFDALEETGKLDNTLIVFLSDNGGQTLRNGRPLRTPVASNAPLSGGKGQLLEGGIRVPFAMRWPGVLPEGVDYPYAVSSLDITATILAATGAQPREGRPLDGVNLVPYLVNAEEGQPHETLFWRKYDAGEYAVIDGDYKIIASDNGQRMYDLSEDTSEESNLIGGAEEDRRFEAMARKHEAWNAEMVPPAYPELGTWPAEGDHMPGWGPQE